MSSPTSLAPDLPDEAPPPIPAEAFEALEEVRRLRARMRIPGHVFLRVDDAPGKPATWAIVVGETTIRQKDLTRRPT